MLVSALFLLLTPYNFSSPTALFSPWLSQSLKTWTVLRVSKHFGFKAHVQKD